MAHEGKFFAIYPVVKELGEFEILGHYKSEERALQIMDEIQAILTPKCLVSDCKPLLEIVDSNPYLISNGDPILISQCSSYVYEMPKE